MSKKKIVFADGYPLASFLADGTTDDETRCPRCSSDNIGLVDVVITSGQQIGVCKNCAANYIVNPPCLIWFAFWGDSARLFGFHPAQESNVYKVLGDPRTESSIDYPFPSEANKAAIDLICGDPPSYPLPNEICYTFGRPNAWRAWMEGGPMPARTMPFTGRILRQEVYP